LNYSKQSATLQQRNDIFLTKGPKMTLEQIREALADRKLSMVARATKVHPNTIRSILKNQANPTHRVIKALSDYLSGGVVNG
jgi:DNA-binding phage protein